MKTPTHTHAHTNTGTDTQTSTNNQAQQTKHNFPEKKIHKHTQTTAIFFFVDTLFD